MGELEEIIGARVKSLRQSRRLPIEVFATRLCITELQVAAIEARKQQLRPDQLLQLCKWLGITIEEFMQGL